MYFIILIEWLMVKLTNINTNQYYLINNSINNIKQLDLFTYLITRIYSGYPTD